jgi:hypothetical protein
MKKTISILLAVAVLLSIAIPFSANAVSKVTEIKQVEATDSSVKFIWETVFGKDVTYEIQMGNNPSELATVRDVSDFFSYETFYNAYELKAGKTYYARVRAYSGNDYGDWSDTLELVTAPKAVENFIQTDCSETTASFKWDASEGATSYKLIERVGDADNVLAEVKETSCTIKGLNNKNEFKNDYYVSPIRSSETFDAQENVDYMWDVNGISARDLKLTPKKPNAPTIKNLWTALNLCDYAVNDVPFANGYKYELYNGSGKKVKSGDAGSDVYVNGGEFFALRTRGYVSFTSTNKVRYGAWSDKKYFGYNFDISAKKAKNKKSIKANWKKFKGASDYTVYISKSSKGGFKKAKVTKKTSVTIKKIGKKKLKKNSAYYIKVVANKKVNKKAAASVTAKVKVKK